MNLQEFYDFHKITRVRFAQLCHVTYESLMAYESGQEVEQETRLRIEIGMQIIEDYALTFDTKTDVKTLDLEQDFHTKQTRKLFENEFKRITTMEL